MNFRHGSLESIILNSIWELEKDGVYKHSVKEVWENANKNSEIKRAYTTVKTVMDRLFEKELLLRVKQGKKFFYRSAYSYDDILRVSLERIAKQYCNSDMTRLSRFVQSLCNDMAISERH